jgi:predicted helicase
MAAPLNAWLPPREWGVGAHAKHLRNLYVYFWRWATWKVFDHDPKNDTGIVCFITVAGFLNGPGFQKMRDYLRRTADRVWVIDCSPEGHQPDVPTRIFQGVQQPVCIVLAARSKKKAADAPAVVKYTILPASNREVKTEALAKLKLESKVWQDCSTDWRAPFLPAATGAWASYPALGEMFAYNGSGVQTKRVWVFAPDADSLKLRWKKLIQAPVELKEQLFHATLRAGKPADRHIRSIIRLPLPGFDLPKNRLIDEKGPCPEPVRYAFRSFNRLWIIPDPRVITQPNAELWGSLSDRQVFMTAPSDRSPTKGPAVTFSALVPDLHHYNGRGGRVFPLWRDAEATMPNLAPQLLELLAASYKTPVTAEDFFAYLAAVAAHPAYTARFQRDLAQPGLRIPVTGQATVFKRAVELGRKVIWLHTFGERFADAKKGRAPTPPRVTNGPKPIIPKEGRIPDDPDSMPDEIEYHGPKRRLVVGTGFVENVPPAVWHYEVSGKRVLTQWFSYRKKNRERPIIGDRRPPSKLGDIQPEHWLSEYTSELLNVLNVLALLVDMEPAQARLMEEICEGPTLEFRPSLSRTQEAK